MIQTFAISLIIIFAIILVAIGFYYRHKKTPEDYYMGGRKVGSWRIAASIFTLVGAGEVVTMTAFAYLFGFYGIALFLGIAGGCLFLASVVPKIRQKSEQYKPYTHTDFIRKFLGIKSEKISLVLSLLAVGSLLLIQIVVGGLLISTLTGLSYEVSAIIIGLVIALYLTLGGFNSVLTTDVLQAISMLFLLVFVVFFYNPSSSSLIQFITSIQATITPLDFIVLLVLGFFAVAGGTDVYQRVYAAKSDKSAKKGLYITSASFLIFGLLMILLGLKIAAQFPLADPNVAFFDFLVSDLGVVLIAIVSIFLVSSIFSSADTELFLSSILVGKLIKGKKELNTLFNQLLIWIIIVAVTILALSFTQLVDIYFILLYAFAIMAPVLIARIFNRGNDTLAFIGMGISLVLLFVLMAFNLLEGLYPLLLIIPPLITFLVPAKEK